MPVEIVVNTEEETERLGATLAELLPNGAVVTLLGTLGAGKTRLVQAIAEASGVPVGVVGSPTFVLVKEYHGKTRAIYHFDAYRLRDSDGLSFVEWADRVDDVIPRDHLEIIVELVDQRTRKFIVSTCGEFDPTFPQRLETALNRTN